ncbi:MAG: type II toxin-antitoxin system RelE/ParE family toxin, partial [Acidobacteriaceae bacterium]
PGYALRELARQPTRTRTNYPEEWHSTENFGLDFRSQGRAVFVYGFEKKDLGNIKANELEAFRELANVLLGYSDSEIAKRVADGALIEIPEPEEDENA